MKHKSIVFLSLLLLLCFSTPPASANAEAGMSEQLPYYVSDVAGVLTSEQWQQLEDSAKNISEHFQCGVYVVTLDDYTKYGSFSSFWDFSQAFYSRYQLGLGEEHNGILLIMSMADRDYSLLAYGSEAHYAFTDYAKEVLEKQFLDNFRNNDWYGGFTDYVDGCDQLLTRAAEGNPVDVTYSSRSGMSDTASTALIIGIPCLAAFATCEGMRRQMKPVKTKAQADDYILPGGIDLSLKRDVFVNRTVSRTVIHSNNRDGHGGGGGTTVNSHGFSGHSGKF